MDRAFYNSLGPVEPGRVRAEYSPSFSPSRIAYTKSKLADLEKQKRGGAAKAKYKTGGMVNPNAKVSKQTTPGSRGVKSGVNPKAAASKVAKGRVGGTSKAPRGAMPKAQMGTTVGPRAMQTYTGTNPERPTGTPVQRKTEGQVKKLRGVAKLKANRINKRIKKG